MYVLLLTILYSSCYGLLRFQLMTTITYNVTASCIVNSLPLTPVKHNEEAEKVNEAVGGDEHRVEVWKTSRWFDQQRQTRQNQHTDN